jgi:hypothetical protein
MGVRQPAHVVLIHMNGWVYDPLRFGCSHLGREFDAKLDVVARTSAIGDNVWVLKLA